MLMLAVALMAMAMAMVLLLIHVTSLATCLSAVYLSANMHILPPKHPDKTVYKLYYWSLRTTSVVCCTSQRHCVA